MTELPVRVTTPLLALITQQSLDEDYQLVARQRAEGSRPVHEGSRHLATGAAIIAFGLLLAVAAVQTARNADVTSAGREQLISRINQRREVVADQQERIAQLRSAIAAGDTALRALGTQLTQVQARRAPLAASAGWSPATGAGVRITVKYNPDAGSGGLVRDDDLALLTTALWRGGATAIDVNGQRLTALSAFRNSADVVRFYGAELSYGVSLSPPYVVQAIGNAATLRARLEDSTAGAAFQAVVGGVGLGLTVQNVSRLRIPAAAESRLVVHDAQPLSRRPKSTDPQENQ
ncbi:DUF881 domain-containing protein [Nocardioides sp. Kera G14]|uniref:DUF881 domain-containing protein n=1 Tax=Nocardioides sp. Kera G14 TaxID=2884264 RepID=UPI001D12F079|nr:DUF881 domain-containing protein [Nocardioides sp. Kera G14]UDY25249.1 DUF881 domain-containing protein [Nocardioides sp. Kera G14]